MSGLEFLDSQLGERLAIAAALILFIFCMGAFAGAMLLTPRRRGSWSFRQPSRSERDRPDLTDVAQQLHAVMAASFQKQRLLSLPEYRAFRVIEGIVTAEKRGHRVFAQANLGEILRSPDESAYRSINSKRVDILVVDSGGWPVLAVEYQGSGHYQGVAAARDAVKKEALRKAGVRYLEVSETDSDTQIQYRVREQLGWRTVAPPDAGRSERTRAASKVPLTLASTSERSPRD